MNWTARASESSGFHCDRSSHIMVCCLKPSDVTLLWLCFSFASWWLTFAPFVRQTWWTTLEQLLGREPSPSWRHSLLELISAWLGSLVWGSTLLIWLLTKLLSQLNTMMMSSMCGSLRLEAPSQSEEILVCDLNSSSYWWQSPTVMRYACNPMLVLLILCRWNSNALSNFLPVGQGCKGVGSIVVCSVCLVNAFWLFI